MKLTQPSFTGGEISQPLYARVDLARYATSLKTLRNMMVSAYGGVYNRPGTRYIAQTKGVDPFVSRLVPFEFSVEQTYVIELGNLYARFYSNSAQIMNGLVPFELVTPWLATEVFDVRYTQSADVMFLTHPNHAPRTISRIDASTFSIAQFVAKNGPFLPLNPSTASLLAASAASGNVTVTSNTPGTFDPTMVGQLLYLENNNFSTLKPWTAGEKNVTVGTYRYNAGNTYKAVQVSTGGTYVLTGGNAPQHDQGAQWDGPGDTRSDGTTTYSVGVQWQYIDCGFGIVQITGYTNDTTVTGAVTLRLPSGVVGGAGTPANSWSMPGDGSTVTFPIAGNISNNNGNYAVTIAGVPVPSDPTAPNNGGGIVGGGGSGGGGAIGRYPKQ